MKNDIFRRVLLTLFALGAITLLCSQAKEKPSESIKIGAAFALTGEAAAWGEASRDAALMAVEEINSEGGIKGKKLELVIEDMKSSSKDSVTAVSKLVNVDKVSAVMVTWLDSYQGSESVVPANIPLISPDAAIESVNAEGNHKNVFSLWYRTSAKAAATFEAMKKANVKTVYLVTQNDSYYATLAEFLEKEALKNGIEVVAEESLNPGTDSRTVISKILQVKPDAIFFGAYDEKLSVDFPKRYAEMIKGKIPLFADEFLKQNIDAKKVSASWVSGAYYYAPADANAEFAENYRNRFGGEPQFSAANTYDTVRILARYFADRPKDLNKYMTTTKFNSVTYGTAGFDQIGGVVSDVSAITESRI